MRCIAYDFLSGFENWSLNQKDEEVKEVVLLPPFFNDGMRCIAYDFNGVFENYSLNHKNEEGKEVPNIRKEYYY
jgi:hypothetical protein